MRSLTHICDRQSQIHCGPGTRPSSSLGGGWPVWSLSSPLSLQAPGRAVVAQDRGQTMGGKSMRNWNGLVKMNTQQLAKQEEELQPCSRDLVGPTPSSHPIHPPIS